MSARWSKLRLRQRRAAFDAQFDRALAGLDSFDVSVLGAVRWLVGPRVRLAMSLSLNLHGRNGVRDFLR